MGEPVGATKYTPPLAADSGKPTVKDEPAFEAPKQESGESTYRLSTSEWIVIGIFASAFAGLTAYSILRDSSGANPCGPHSFGSSFPD